MASAADQRTSIHALIGFWALLCLIYFSWLVVIWPGVLGSDSFAIMMEVDHPESFRSGKSVAWYYFVRATYGVTQRAEVAIAVLMLLCAFFFARMLAWYWTNQKYRLCVLLLLFIAVAPQQVYFAGTLYPDMIFAVASTALLFEIWLMCNQRQSTWLSWIVVALALPFALFSRSNGIIYLLPVIVATFFIPLRSRIALIALLCFWCALNFAATRVHHSTAQSAVFPMVAFETTKLFQPRSMNDLWDSDPALKDPWVLNEPKISARTREILLSHTTKEKLLAYSDPAYWDMLVYHPSGPLLSGLPKAQQDELVHEFFRYNLWHNLPDVAASRINVFLTAALAQGALPAFDFARFVISRTETTSVFRRFKLEKAEQVLRSIQRISYEWRWLLWTPLIGLLLLVRALSKGLATKNWPLLILSVPFAMQFLGIVTFASAGEYRYLLPFFTLPFALAAALSKLPGK